MNTRTDEPEGMLPNVIRNIAYCTGPPVKPLPGTPRSVRAFPNWNSPARPEKVALFGVVAGGMMSTIPSGVTPVTVAPPMLKLLITPNGIFAISPRPDDPRASTMIPTSRLETGPGRVIVGSMRVFVETSMSIATIGSATTVVVTRAPVEGAVSLLSML